jgi:PadR family transcriptional regulator, regulatory protein PadR
MSESDRSSGLVQGTLEMLILRSLALEPMHGYGIGGRLEQISRGALRVNAGSLFPAFRRLERDGQVKAEWRVTENGRRAKYYALTVRGKATLAKSTKEWHSQTRAISRVLNASLAKLS